MSSCNLPLALSPYSQDSGVGGDVSSVCSPSQTPTRLIVDSETVSSSSGLFLSPSANGDQVYQEDQQQRQQQQRNKHQHELPVTLNNCEYFYPGDSSMSLPVNSNVTRSSVSSRIKHLEKLLERKKSPSKATSSVASSFHSISVKGVPISPSLHINNHSSVTSSVTCAIEKAGGSTAATTGSNSDTINEQIKQLNLTLTTGRNLVPPWKLVKSNARIHDDFLASSTSRRYARQNDPLGELQVLFDQLALEDDEDLLDRADRRDWPIQFYHMQKHIQERKKKKKQNLHQVNDRQEKNKLCQQQQVSSYNMTSQMSCLKHKESNKCCNNCTRVRAPPVRKSALPDILSDDLAVRKRLHNSKHLSSSCSSIDGTSYNKYLPMASFLLFSPAFIPSIASPSTKHVTSSLDDMSMQPDIDADDLNWRRFTGSSGTIVPIPPRHPPFGIPLRVDKVPCLHDYTRVQPQNATRVGRLHPIKDDLAVRAWRKDVNDRPSSPNTLLPVTTANLIKMLHANKPQEKPSRPPLPPLTHLFNVSHSSPAKLVEFTV